MLLPTRATKRVPEVARACLAALGTQLLSLKEQILEFDRMIIAWHRSNQTSKQVPTKKLGRFDCVDCGATIHSWYGVFGYSGCKAVRMDRGRGNAALILRLQILRHLRDRQIQGDVV